MKTIRPQIIFILFKISFIQFVIAIVHHKT